MVEPSQQDPRARRVRAQRLRLPGGLCRRVQVVPGLMGTRQVGQDVGILGMPRLAAP